MAEGAECKCITKWPVKTWVEMCKHMAEEADIAIVLHSAKCASTLHVHLQLHLHHHLPTLTLTLKP